MCAVAAWACYTWPPCQPGRVSTGREQRGEREREKRWHAAGTVKGTRESGTQVEKIPHPASNQTEATLTKRRQSHSIYSSEM